MPSDIAANARQLLTGAGIGSRLVGLNDEEIRAIATAQEAVIPTAYREFLRVAGRRAGDLWRGSEAFYPELLRLRKDALALLEENSRPFDLPSGALVILMHQGYQFLYLLPGASDPAVWLYREPRKEPERIAETFSSLLRGALSELPNVHREAS
jgi:hypothetical protein